MENMPELVAAVAAVDQIRRIGLVQKIMKSRYQRWPWAGWVKTQPNAPFRGGFVRR